MGETRLPTGFRFGVSDSGYQSEGGYNGPGGPTNNWAAWERSGRAHPPGDANEFWERFPEHFDAAAEAGCDAYRLSVEWTRCEPDPGKIDGGALEHYARILRSCRDHGLEPVVALHHFTHPSWLGREFWLRGDAPQQFARWTQLVIDHLAPYCNRWVTVNEINASAIGSYLIGYFPPGHRFQRRSMVEAVDHMLAAHVVSYEVLHRAQPDAKVGTNTYAFWSYDADRVLVDTLLGRSHGIAAEDLSEWIDERRRQFEAVALAGLSKVDATRDLVVNRALQAFLRIQDALPRTVEAVYESPYACSVDVDQVSYYDPRLATYPRLPGRRVAGKRRLGPDPAHCEQTPGPEHLVNYLRAIHEPGRPIWLLENGLCNEVVDGESHDRPDGWDRPMYLRRHLAAVMDAIDAGVEVTGYFHWSLFDNYQWGEYESRFGLYGVARENGTKFLELDSMGHDSAGAYRTLIDALRAGDRTVLHD